MILINPAKKITIRRVIIIKKKVPLFTRPKETFTTEISH